MKKYGLLFLLIFTVCFTQAQAYKKVRLGAGAMLIGGGDNGVYIAGSIEPAYGFNDRFMLSYRFEGATGGFGMKGGHSTDYLSHVIIGRYYFGFKSHTRFFYGNGLGVYTRDAYSITDNTVPITTYDYPKATGFGILVQTGLEHRHFTLSLDINSIVASKNNDSGGFYMGLKTGFFFGGGKK